MAERTQKPTGYYAVECITNGRRAPSRVVLFPDRPVLTDGERFNLALQLLQTAENFLNQHDLVLTGRLTLFLRQSTDMLMNMACLAAPQLHLQPGHEALMSVFSRPAYYEKLSRHLMPILIAWLMAESMGEADSPPAGSWKDSQIEALLQNDIQSIDRLIPMLLHLHYGWTAHLFCEEFQMEPPPPPPLPTEIEKRLIPARQLQIDLRRKYLSVMNAAHYQALREALAFNTFRKMEDSPWPTASLHKGSARGQAQLLPIRVDNEPFLPPETQQQLMDRMWEQRADLSDLDADILDLLGSLWLQQARSPNDPGFADIDELLSLRALKPKTGAEGRSSGYRAEQRQQLYRALQHISSLWITMSQMDSFTQQGMGRRARRIKQEVQSRAFVITDVSGQRLGDSPFEVKRFLFRPGAVFGQFLYGPGRQTALLSARAVEYDPYRQDWEKRLARYLSWQWRIQASRGNYLRSFKVRTLMEAAGKTVDERNPLRTRERLEKALETLQEDKVVRGWQWDQWDEAILEGNGWVHLWLNWTVIIEPPDSVKQAYQAILRPASSLPPIPPGTLAERLQFRRQQLGYSQMKMAELFHVSQAYYSMLEKGTRKPSASVLVKIERWLEPEGDDQELALL
jgi:DNA-binding XRE family transcriptional regulator